jgi:hypothetical protein
MLVRHLSTVVLLAFSAVLLTASCFQTPEAYDTAFPSVEQADEQGGGAESLGQAPQPGGGDRSGRRISSLS